MTVHPWSTALVTGASSGIGEAMAAQLGAAGIPTVIVARRRERLDALAALHPSLEPLAADLKDPAGRAAVVARLTDPVRPIELLVNNAGYGISGPVASTATSDLLGMIELNISALTELTRAALTPMTSARKGWIMQVSSVASFQAGPSAAVYSATKAYVTSLTEALSEELRGTGVKVTALCPGLTTSEFHEVSGMARVGDMPGAAWMTSEAVAEAGLRAAAAGKVIAIPGLINKAVVSSSSALPRSVVRRTAGLLMRDRR